ncbi:50S ribosomal protein L32 [Gottschalkia acidurici]|uniref:50S ribosomal protein L32 n=1 Tax=Clostridium acidurici TaxID=1556 RepID=UPI0002D7FD51|nr:50S ribosomal protein L32 [Gottschalkia acidurici]
MAVPKRKISKSKRDKRRASAQVLTKATIVECPQCHETKLPHRVCGSCGYYKNREVVSVE